MPIKQQVEILKESAPHVVVGTPGSTEAGKSLVSCIHANSASCVSTWGPACGLIEISQLHSFPFLLTDTSHLATLWVPQLSLVTLEHGLQMFSMSTSLNAVFFWQSHRALIGPTNSGGVERTGSKSRIPRVLALCCETKALLALFLLLAKFWAASLREPTCSAFSDT